MNPETADRDPLTIAHELLEIDTSAIGGNIIVDGVDVLETTRNAQTVARAVIAVANLADRQDREVYETFGRPIPSHVGHLIRAALNGENHE